MNSTGIKLGTIKTRKIAVLWSGIAVKLCVLSLWLLLIPQVAWANEGTPALAKGLKKTWLVRYQVLPELGHVFLSVEWSYLDLSGKEDSLLKRDILVVQKEYFWQKKRRLKKSITLEGVKLDLVVTSSKNPHPYPNAPEYLPHLEFWVDGRKKGDFHFGEYAGGELFLHNIRFNMIEKYWSEFTFEMSGQKFTQNNVFTRDFKNSSVVTSKMIQSEIHLWSRIE